MSSPTPSEPQGSARAGTILEGKRELWGDALRFCSTAVWLPWIFIKRPEEWRLQAIMGAILALSGLAFLAARWDLIPRARRTVVALLDVSLLTGLVWGLGSCTTPVIIFFLAAVLAATMSASTRTGLVVTVGVLVGYGSVLVLEARGVLPVAPFARPGLGPHETSGGRIFAFTTVGIGVVVVYGFLVFVRRRLESGAERERTLRLAEQAAQQKALELQGQLELAQRMESLGRLAGGVAHDFNNLLTVMQGAYAYALEEVPGQGDMRDALEDGLGAARRAANLTQQLLAFSRRQPVRPQVLAPGELIVRTRRMLQRVIGEDVQVQLELGAAPWPVKIDPVQLEQVLLNLAVNARDAMPKGGRLTISCHNLELGPAECAARPGLAPGSFVEIRVVDTGSGMDEQTLRRALEPFFTTKPVGRGTGLGLSTVFGIMQQNQGWFELSSKMGEGTTARLLLPRNEGSPAPLPEREASDPRGNETVLLVEDEESLRRMARRALERHGYTVLEADCGEKAIEAAGAHSGPIEVLVTDMVMPRLTGKALAEQMRRVRPSLKVLFMSGYSPDALDQESLLADGARFLAKPFSPDQLASNVRQLLDSDPAPLSR